MINEIIIFNYYPLKHPFVISICEPNESSEVIGGASSPGGTILVG